MYRLSFWVGSLFLFLGLLSSQFYIFPSGYPQPAHFLIIFFSLVVLFGRFWSADIFLSLGSRYIFLFFLYVLILNSFWFFYYGDYSFLEFPVYCFYNLIVLYSLAVFLLRFGDSGGKVVVFACFLGVLILLLVWFLGLGEYRFLPRYNGFFNDPNQMAFWVLCVASIYYMLSRNGIFFKAIFFVVCVLLILVTMSRSALVGLSVMSIGVMLRLGFFSGRNVVFKFLNISILSFSIFALSLYVSNSEIFENVIERVAHTSVERQLESRGFDRVVKYPEYLLFGAGQGLDERFGLKEEVHSTWVGIFFYYGIFGLSLFLSFLVCVLRRFSFSDLLICLGPLFYGFSTFGARTPIFWMFLSVLLVYSVTRNKVDVNVGAA
jgi:hypothetical protein